MRVPSRAEVAALLKCLPRSGALDADLDSLADNIRTVFSQPGTVDPDVMARTTSSGWRTEADKPTASHLVRISRLVMDLARALERMPSIGWQAIDSAEMAARLLANKEVDGDELIVRELLEDFARSKEIIVDTLAWQMQLGATKRSDQKMRLHAFALQLGRAFEAVTGVAPTRRYDAHQDIEYGPFLHFVIDARALFGHPASAATIAKSAVSQMQKTSGTRLMDKSAGEDR